MFRQVIANLLMNVADNVEMFESTALDGSDLLNEVTHLDPDIILLEESSPLSTNSPLVPMLIAKPGRCLIVISQEHNWIDVVHCENFHLSSASDLVNTIKFMESGNYLVADKEHKPER